jgi:hypothetical protein
VLPAVAGRKERRAIRRPAVFSINEIGDIGPDERGALPGGSGIVRHVSMLSQKTLREGLILLARVM